jgi:hypothetical protein
MVAALVLSPFYPQIAFEQVSDWRHGMTLTIDWDAIAFLNPRTASMQDGHHGPAIEAWLRDLLGDTYDRPATEHRIARKKGVIGPGDLRVPPGGMTLQSIRDLDVECHRTQIIGEGDIPYVVSLDGCFDPWFRGAVIAPRRRNGGGRLEVPFDAVRMHKSIESHNAPQCSHNRFDGRIEGVWREAAIRAGSVGWSTAQEDHYTGDVKIFGAFDARTDDAADLCKYGRVCGNGAWSNNRRHHYGYTAVSWCETAVLTRFGADVVLDNIAADGCRDVFAFGGATSKMTVLSGEAENCSRFLVDLLVSGHDKTARISNFYMKHDLWRPGLPRPYGWEEPYEPLASWGTSGGLILDNVTLSFIPVRRASNGQLRYARNIHQDPKTGEDRYELTDLKAPRFIVFGAGATEVTTRNCAAHGYSGGPGQNELFYIRHDSNAARCHHEHWKNTTWDGRVTRHHTTAIDQRVMDRTSP